MLYTLEDFKAAEKAHQEALAEEALKHEKQAKVRAAAENTIARLNAALVPYEQARIAAYEKLRDLRPRLLGPWEDSEYFSSVILRAGGTDKCWDRRVWLRRMGSRDLIWTADIHRVGAPGSVSVGFGPPAVLPENRVEDFLDKKRQTEKVLIEMGYILPERA